MAVTIPPPAVVVVVVTVAVLCVGTFVAQFLVDGYRPETAIYGMFAAIVTYMTWSGRQGGDGT